MFGENLTVDGLADDEVCIGDRYRIGEAVFEVTQPRVTCYRVGVRTSEPELPALLVSHHRPGFYMRVITEGRIQAGDSIVKVGTAAEPLSIAEIDALLYLPHRDSAKLQIAVDNPALSPGWQASFRDMIDAGGQGSPAGAAPPSVKPAWAGFQSLRVSKVVPESATVSSIYLAAADGSQLPDHLAGQFLTMRIPESGDPAPVRSYSLSSAPGTGAYRISVKREPHGVASTYLTSRLRPGDIIAAAAPRGEFVLDDGSGPVALISAGIGVTPVLSILHQLADQHSAREVWWIHGARGPREHPLAAEAQALITSLPGGHEQVFYTAATASELDAAQALPGRLSADRLAALAIPADSTAYVCGPAAFMTDMQRALVSIGIDAARVRTELFGTVAAINPGLADQSKPPPHQPPGPAGTGPLVTFARSGLSTRFPVAGHSILDLADACDVPTRFSCRTGVCHTCITALLTGDVTYSPDPLDAPVAGEVLICCSQPVNDVVLDM
jgi:ferredoxin-NADP reductase